MQNAFKFSHRGGHVFLRTSATEQRVRIEIEDECGGLPPGKVDDFFGAFRQGGDNRSGLGLGLYISRQGIEANDGTLDVVDVPGHGCIFTIELPRTIAA
jgi:signal transduction histidine kinase